ncbi:hypothetical protein DY000_02043436 [Brassica cretica]|uniref:Uncharacterized protein n=1 Tax=Brassica cretica TaxID=69181 RepID=A0ABQ7BFD5_BRACR|nr:hypothetical protein DY000_02043436 [Brassica cretica]
MAACTNCFSPRIRNRPAQGLSSRLAFVGRGQSDINFHQREEPDVRRGNVCFGVEEDEATAQSLEAPRRESRSASTSQSKPSAKMTNRNKVTSPTDLHAGDGFGCDESSRALSQSRAALERRSEQGRKEARRRREIRVERKFWGRVVFDLCYTCTWTRTSLLFFIAYLLELIKTFKNF